MEEEKLTDEEKEIEDKIYDILLIKEYIDYLKEYSPTTLILHDGELITLKQFNKIFNSIGNLEPEPWKKFLDKIADMALNDKGYIKYLEEEH